MGTSLFIAKNSWGYVTSVSPSYYSQAHMKQGAGGGGFSLPNKLLQFFYFVSEKGCKSHGHWNDNVMIT